MSTALDPKKVFAIFEGCLFRRNKDAGKPVRAESITEAEFHSERLKNHKMEIQALLDELPDEFKESAGGGTSFLGACYDRHGNQWTGLQERVEQLFLLGIAIGKVGIPLPREVWHALPGGMPMYVVKS